MSYSFKTRVGTFRIKPEGGLWVIWLGTDENLGSYGSAQQAAEDLAGGHTFTPSNGVDTSTLEIPSDVEDWQRHS